MSLTFKKNNYSKDLIVKMLTEIINIILNLCVFTIYSKNLLKSDYSVINQVLLLGMLISSILMLRINTAFCVFFSDDEEKKKALSIYLTSSILVFSLGCILCIISIIFNKLVSEIIFGINLSYLIKWIVIYSIVYGLSNLSIDFFRGNLKLIYCSFLLLVRSILIVVGVSVLKFNNKITVFNLVLSYILVEVILYLLSFVIILKKYGTYDKKFISLRKYFKYSLPLIPYLILSWGTNNIGKFIINHKLGLNDAGIYTFYFTLINRIFFLQPVIGYVVFPHLSKTWHKDREKVNIELQNIFKLIFFLSIPLIIGLIKLLPFFLKIISNNKYEVNKKLVLVLCINFLIIAISNIYSYIIDFTMKTIYYNYILIITFFSNVIFNLYFISKFGVLGVGISSLCSSIIQVVITILICKKITKFLLYIDYKFYFNLVISNFGMFIIISNVFSNSTTTNFILTIILGAVTYILIFIFINKILKKMESFYERNNKKNFK